MEEAPILKARILTSVVDPGFFWAIDRTTDGKEILRENDILYPTIEDAKAAAVAKIRSFMCGEYPSDMAGELFGYLYQIRQSHTDRFPLNKFCIADQTEAGLPCFETFDEAKAYLNAAPFPGDVLRYCRDPWGRKSVITAGIVYRKEEGEPLYWKARALMQARHKWTIKLPEWTEGGGVDLRELIETEPLTEADFLRIARLRPGQKITLPIGILQRAPEISREEWTRTHRDYKGYIDGIPYVMQLCNEKGGSYLQPVNIID